MAVRFDAAADRLLRTANLPSTELYSVCFWWYPVSITGFSVVFDLDANSGSDQNEDEFGTTTNDGGTTWQTTSYVDKAGAATQVDGGVIAAGNWYHIGISRESATSLKIYLNGVLDITNTRDVTGRTAATRMEFGGAHSANKYAHNGRVACLKVWDAGLTQAEIQDEIYTILPKRTANLNVWSPTFPGATERGLDYSGNVRNWTQSGTLTDEDQPPVSWGARSYWVQPLIVASGGATIIPQVMHQRMLQGMS